MSCCAVAGCGNNHKKTLGTDVKYFRFPKDPCIAKLWSRVCKREKIHNFQHARICSLHFTPSSYEVSLKQRLLNYEPTKVRTLKASAVPTENLNPSLLSTDWKRELAAETNVSKRKNKRPRKIILEQPTFNDGTACSERNVDQDVDKWKTQILELEAEVLSLRMKSKGLEAENKQLREDLIETRNKHFSDTERIKKVLKNIFTAAQINELLNPSKTECSKIQMI